MKLFKDLKLFYVYLAGAIEGDKKEGGTGWRDSMTPDLDKIGIYVQDPCRTEPLATGLEVMEAQDQFNRWIQGGCNELFAKKFKVIVKKDIRMVERSDFLIVHLFEDVNTTGTIHEMARAWELKKPIYMIWYGAKSKMSKWALFLVMASGGRVFDNRKQCSDFIQATYSLENVNIFRKTIQYFKAISRTIEEYFYHKFYIGGLKKMAETQKERNERLG